MGLVTCTATIDNGGWRASIGDVFDDSAFIVARFPNNFGAVVVKGVYLTGSINVTVPAITDPAIRSVDVDISADPLTFVAAVGDEVRALPSVDMETNARILNAYVIAADSIRVVFASAGGNVTGGAKAFKFLMRDLT